MESREIFFKFNEDTFQAVNGFMIVKQNESIKDIKGLSLTKSSELSRTSGIIKSSSKFGNQEPISIGTEVVFSKYAGFESSIKGDNYLIIAREEILFYLK